MMPYTAPQGDNARHTDAPTWLPVRLHDTWWAVPTRAIKECLPASPSVALPMAPSHFSGVLNVRGHAVALVRVDVFLQVQPGAEPFSWALWVQAGGMQAALLCHAVEAPQKAPIVPASVGPCLQGETESAAHGTLFALDVAALLTAAKPGAAP